MSDRRLDEGCALQAVLTAGEFILEWTRELNEHALWSNKLGVLTSGACLMVFRAVRHMQGKHE